MDQIGKLLEYFKHIARDFFVYMLSGLVVIANLAFIDYLLNKLHFFTFLTETNSIIIILISSYIIGHIVASIRDLLFPYFKNTASVNFGKEIEIFLKNNDLYNYFIERQNQLTYMRINLSISFLLLAFLDIFLSFYTKDIKSIFLLFIGNILLGFAFTLFCLAENSMQDFQNKINEIYKILKNKKDT